MEMASTHVDEAGYQVPLGQQAKLQPPGLGGLVAETDMDGNYDDPNNDDDYDSHSSSDGAGDDDNIYEEYNLPASVPATDGYLRPANDPFDLDVSAVAIDRATQLGKGNYGVVYQGTLVGAAGGTASTLVAVKMLPEDRPVEQAERQEFWEEIKFLRELQVRGGHANVIGFVGYVVADAMFMVTEFAARGSLLGYLREAAKSKGVNALPEALAVRFALEIARGMRYIAAQKMVHRDLAARNILLSTKLECKVTDFGLARDLYEGDGQYVANAGYKESNPTAWKWTSLEGLRQSTYTIEGDVWSYGILLSEICSLGDMPYVPPMG